jgi:Hemerythrin HHE cation binding domain
MHVHVCRCAVTDQDFGDGLAAELRWVHSLIRRDLETVRWLADELDDGLSGPEAAERIGDLEIGSALWQLKINCLQYCRFVHMHHHGESALLFPRLRAANPALGPVVDRLEADHARVADLLDDVSATAAQLADREDGEVRKRLIAGLASLSDDLLAHLQYEEDNISGTLRTWTSWGDW